MRAAVALGAVLFLVALAPAGAAAATSDTELVSRSSGFPGATGGAPSFLPSISTNGRYVAFASAADNLSDDDLDGTVDVFLRDRLAGTTQLVSRADGVNGAAADGFSANSGPPSISADGRYVAFDSAAQNLSPADPDRKSVV